jgi:hypothetical protein
MNNATQLKVTVSLANAKGAGAAHIASLIAQALAGK